MESIQYILNTVVGFFTYFIVTFVFFQLWVYIYSDGQNTIAGYDLNQMVWYVMLTELMWFVNSNQTLLNQMSTDIRSGGIAYGINKPYHYLLYCIAKHFGDIAVRFVIYLILGIFLGVMFVGPIESFRLWQVPFVMIVFFLGLTLNALIRMMINICSFWIEEARPIQWIYDKFIIVLGTTFPIEIFPLWARNFLYYSPIFVITYGPVKLILDFSFPLFFKVLIAQLGYLGGISVLMYVMYQKGVKRLNVNGG